MDASARIYVAGRATLIGSAILRLLDHQGFVGVVDDQEPHFGDRADVDSFFDRVRPEYVFVTAGATAGIAGNQTFPADLMVDNLSIAHHVIPAAWRSGAKKLVYLASSCIYPKHAPQPLHVSSLWTGPLEPTSAAYAVAKLAGMTLCAAYRQQHGTSFVSAIGADTYGPGDDFHPDNAHVVGALVARIHDAKIAGAPCVSVWGTGTPRREFIYVDDLADACIVALRDYEGRDPINLGIGVTTSIAELAETIREVVGYRGELRFDPSKPDGTPFKGLDSTVLHEMGWRARWDLVSGLRRTYDWFLRTNAPRQAHAADRQP